MLQKFAVVFGVVFVIIGILGFIPAVSPQGHLLGIFHINAAHNLVHIVSGLIALWCGFNSYMYSQVFFRIFGAIYLVVAALGFYYGNQDILGLVANNMADTWLHVVVAALSLYLGFAYQSAD